MLHKFDAGTMEEKLSNAEIKKRTIELYDMLPDDEEGRKARIDIRDKVIELNYTTFGYIAKHKNIKNNMVTYEDKFQSAVLHFCECWWKFRWKGHYRTDLSFMTFFVPRIGEMMERELYEVKYSVERSLKMEVANQLDKHWSKVTYDDLSNPKLHLPIDKLNSLKAVLGILYTADLEDHMLYIPGPVEYNSEFENLDDNYDSIEEMLVREMVERETTLDDEVLMQISDMYSVDIKLLKAKLPIAEKLLYTRLKSNIELTDTFRAE